MVEIPKSRRAWRVNRQGKPGDVLSLDETPVPQLKKGEVLVKVQAAALNPVDYKLMGMVPNWISGRPSVVGADFAGVIADSNGTSLSVGEAVMGWNPMSIRKPAEGAVAEFIKVPSEQVIKAPNGSPTDYAGTCLVGQTAYQGLISVGELQEGQSVFINGGSSSVGRFAIQIAKAKGAFVATSCSPAKIESMKELGADEVYDYTTSPLHQQLKERKATPKFHIFFDTIGVTEFEYFGKSPSYLVPGGTFVTVGSEGLKGALTLSRCLLQPRWLGGVPRKFKLFLVAPDRKRLESLRELMVEGKVKCHVDSVFKFEDTIKAFDRLMTGKANGKVVIDISS